MEVDISFNDRTMKTSVYIKMDAPEQLLLSEGVCRQLGILTYHPDVQPGNGDNRELGLRPNYVSECKVPMVRVQLIRDVHLLPNECVVTEARLVSEEVCELDKPLLFEPDST